MTVATTTNLTGILTGNGANVGFVAIPLPVASGGTGVSVKPARQTYAISPDPTGTTNPAQTMMGIGATATITPLTSGVVLIIVTGILANDTATDGASAQIYYGTGAAPPHAAGFTGTPLGSIKAMVAATGPGAQGVALAFIATGLTISTPYWIDIALNAVTAGTASISNVDVVAIEL